MKKVLMLFCAFTLVTFSCEQENSSQNSDEVELNKSISFENLTNSKIGVENKGKVELNVSDEKIMETFRNFVKINELELVPRSFEVVNIDNANYLRFYSDNNQVSTIALLKNENGEFQTGTTVCTSVACASGGGCVPSGVYCTKCLPLGPDGPSGDCKRTTTVVIDP